MHCHFIIRQDRQPVQAERGMDIYEANVTDRSKRLNGGGSDPIIEGLKRMYNETLNEPVPEDFLLLLHKIDAARSSLPQNNGEQE